MNKFSDRVALVTGASKSIGAGMARRLAPEGASVIVIHAPDKGDAEQVVAGIVSAGGNAVGVDVTNEDDVVPLSREIRQKFGRFDVLVSDAALCNLAPRESASVSEFNVLAITQTSRGGTLDDIVPAVAFLASNEASCVTRESRVIAGDLSM